MQIELRNMLVVMLSWVTTPAASLPAVKHRLCLGLADAWGQVDCGPHVSVTVGV